jgi:hypothetical protein
VNKSMNGWREVELIPRKEGKKFNEESKPYENL